MSSMSSHIVRRLIFAGLFVLAIFSARLASAGVVTLESLATEQFIPSSSPALLGPITEGGRKGWACAPEKAAASKMWAAAELPADHHEP